MTVKVGSRAKTMRLKPQWWLEEVPWRNSQSSGESDDVAERDVALSVLDGIDIGPIQTRVQGQLFLRGPFLFAGGSELFSERLLDLFFWSHSSRM